MSEALGSHYDWFRAIHLTFVIFWMAGLLYLPRLFVYHSKAEVGSELDKVLIQQEERLQKIIIIPSMFLSFAFGLLLFSFRPGLLNNGSWFLVKIVLLGFIFMYHGMLSSDGVKFKRGERPRSEKFYRITNEIPALLIFFIVILAIVEPF